MNRAADGISATDPRTRVLVGLCGFTMAMREYARYFPVVEVQNTFYDPPTDAVLQKWLASTASSLEYTMKVWQVVTHPASSPTYRRMKRPFEAAGEPGFFRDTPAVAAGWRRSVECATLLSATAMLFQCPASFRPTPENVEHMRRFFTVIERPRARLLWEPRGAAWVKQRDLAMALCEELRLVLVVDPFVTPPGRGHPVYWRLHGITGPRHTYSDAELQRLQRMLVAVGCLQPAYVMFNNLPRVGDAKRFVQLVIAGQT